MRWQHVLTWLDVSSDLMPLPQCFPGGKSSFLAMACFSAEFCFSSGFRKSVCFLFGKLLLSLVALFVVLLTMSKRLLRWNYSRFTSGESSVNLFGLSKVPFGITVNCVLDFKLEVMCEIFCNKTLHL